MKLKRNFYITYLIIKNWFLPKEIFRLVGYLSHHFLFSNIPSFYKQTINQDIKEFKKNEFCILVLNGPSTADFDLSLIPKSLDILTVNQFSNSKYSKNIQSNFHLVAEPVSSFENKSKNLYSQAINKCLQHNSKCYITNTSALKYISKNKLNRVRTIKYSFLKMHDYIYGDIHLNKRLPLVECSGTALIAYAIALNYKNIFVVGLDQNQLSFKNHINDNFYDENSNNSIKSSERKYKNFFLRLVDKANTIEALLNLTRIARKRGIKIYNISHLKSFIDFWEPFDFNELIKI